MPATAPEIFPLPDAPGAYALLIDLSTPLLLPKDQSLEPGRYVYAGSARGPGGIRARCARHVKPSKIVHWHIDRLTNTARVGAVAAFPEGTECGIVDRLLSAHGAWTPIRGFGSSDCTRCAAHLVRLDAAFDLAAAAEDLAAACGAQRAVIWSHPRPD
ncbi:GIY-YIG nuclease family protein [Magnetospira thiophila]